MKAELRMCVAFILAGVAGIQPAAAFEPEEATIEGMQRAIHSGEVTCK